MRIASSEIMCMFFESCQQRAEDVWDNDHERYRFQYMLMHIVVMLILFGLLIVQVLMIAARLDSYDAYALENISWYHTFLPFFILVFLFTLFVMMWVPAIGRFQSGKRQMNVIMLMAAIIITVICFGVSLMMAIENFNIMSENRRTVLLYEQDAKTSPSDSSESVDQNLFSDWPDKDDLSPTAPSIKMTDLEILPLPHTWDGVFTPIYAWGTLFLLWNFFSFTNGRSAESNLITFCCVDAPELSLTGDSYD